MLLNNNDNKIVILAIMLCFQSLRIILKCKMNMVPSSQFSILTWDSFSWGWNYFLSQILHGLDIFFLTLIGYGIAMS